MPSADLRFAEHQRAEHPAALDRFLHLRRQVGNRGRAARQPVQRGGHVGRELRRIEFEMPDDPMQVGILHLQDLLHPVHQLDIRIAAQLAEHRRALDRLVGDRIEFAEQGGSADFCHGTDLQSGRCGGQFGVDRARHAVGARIKEQVGCVNRFSTRHQPGGPSQPALLAQPGGRHFLAPEDQVHVPHQRVAGIVADDRNQPVETDPAWQQAQVIGQRQRPEHDAEFVLPAPDPPAKQRRPAQHRCFRPIAQPGSVAHRQIEPGANEAFDANRHVEERRQDRSQSLRMPCLARQMSGEMQLGQVRHGVAVAQTVHAQSAQRPHIQCEPVLRRAVEADRRARVGPGAVEQRQRPVMEDVGEALEGRVAMVAATVPCIFRQVQRQRAIGTEQAEEMHQQPCRSSVFPWLPGGQRGRGENDRRFLRQPHRVLCRPHAAAQARPVMIARLQPPHCLIKAVRPRRRGDPFQQVRFGRRRLGWRVDEQIERVPAGLLPGIFPGVRFGIAL